MKFSVLISVYEKERAEYLKQALESIVNQTKKPNQIVIVEDGKLTKELENIIHKYYKKYPNTIKVVSYKENRGLGYALQKGIIECDYEYIARMDSDDIARKDRFQRQISYLEKNPDIDILGGYLQEYDETMSKKLSIKKVPLTNNDIYKSLGRQNPFNHSTVMFKKQAVIKSGNYQQTIIEDYELWIQMCSNKCQMVNIPFILVNFRTSKKMYKRRTGLKYLLGIKKVESMLLKNKFISIWQYIQNIIIRASLATIPSEMKKYIYPKVIRKWN